jgi:RNA polymerase sigma-70 factor (ECF subfamily)
METISDVKLIEEYLKGDEKSLEILIARYLKPIYSFVYKYIGDNAKAEDITQEVFIKVWKNIKKFDRKKSFKTWIFTIAKNTAIDWQRKKKSIPLSKFEDEKGRNSITEKLEDLSLLPDELFERKNIAEILKLTMKRLAPDQRTILLLRYDEHLKFREIAEILNEPLQTVKSRHRRAVINLKELLNDESKNQLNTY